MKALTLPQARCFRPAAPGARRAVPLPARAGKGFGQREAESSSSSAGEQRRDTGPPPPRSQPPPQRTQPPPPPVREVPEVVNQRMLNRMLTFSLLPVLLGFLSLPLLAYVQVGLKVELPTGTAFAVSGLFFGAGVLGITYGILSASWDENTEGSALGLEQFKSNTSPLIDRIKQGPGKR